jgi:hypothetical protein
MTSRAKVHLATKKSFTWRQN